MGRVCGEAADGDEAMERSRTLHPDGFVIDAGMPHRSSEFSKLCEPALFKAPHWAEPADFVFFCRP